MTLHRFGTSLAFARFCGLDERRKVMRKLFNFCLSLLLVMSLMASCSTQKTTVTRDVEYDSRTGEPVRVERETTTTTDTTGDTGLLSGTVNVIGEVISLPFRAVGGLIRAIF
jgi:hypothetical protein